MTKKQLILVKTEQRFNSIIPLCQKTIHGNKGLQLCE